MDVVIYKTTVSSNVSCKKGCKYLIGNKMMKKLHHYILWLDISAHAKNCDETKWVFFKEDGELLKKKNQIWYSLSNRLKHYCDSKPIDNRKYLITKRKSYEGTIKTEFYG